jgi:hypothetical protein
MHAGSASNAEPERLWTDPAGFQGILTEAQDLTLDREFDECSPIGLHAGFPPAERSVHVIIPAVRGTAPMTELRPLERTCLRYLALHPDSPPPPQFGATLLESLVARGLLERRQTTYMPPLPAYYHYRLTRRGRRALLAATGH